MVGPYDQAQMACWLERTRNDILIFFFCNEYALISKNVPTWETLLPEIPLDFVITLKIMPLQGYWLMCPIEEIVN